MKTSQRFTHGLLLAVLGLELTSPVLAADPSGKATLAAGRAAPVNFV